MATAASSFLYVATRPEGGYRVGTLQGKDERHVVAQLRKQRLVPVRTVELPKWAAGSGKVALKDQGEIHQQLAQLLSRGVPLVEALEVVEQSVSGGTQPRVTKVKEMVSAGAAFSSACAATKLFDDVTNAVYAAAEKTGDLAGAAAQLNQSARRQLAIRGKVATLMAYPSMVLMISVGASLVLLTYVVPKVGTTLQEQLAATGGELPLYTRILMTVGIFIRDNWMWVLLGTVAAIVAIVIFRAKVLLFLQGMLRRLPVMKDVVLAQESARFFTVMSAMSRTGIPLADSLGVAIPSVQHVVLRQQLMTLRTRLIEGGVLRHLIDKVTALPVGTRRLMIAAERSGDLQQAFETLGKDMEEELDRRTSRLLAVLEPGLIVLMAVLIGGLILSIMIPLLTITGQVGG
ncbi:MAG: type II secretion system F family protein [Phycisphaerae bacterium]|jgi:type IV pilus assembly protein PilC